MSTRIRCSTCNAEWPATVDKCYKCGQVLGGGAFAESDEEIAARLLGHPSPARSAGVYREGDRLVMTEGCLMPRRCPLCNSDDVFDDLELEIRRESREWSGIAGVVKMGMDAVSGWDYTGPVSVTVHFCERHRYRLRNRLILGSAITAVSLLYLLIAYLLNSFNQPGREYYDVVIAVVGAVAGVVMLAICGQNQALVWFKPRKFVDRTVWVTGACREFLDTLPGTR